MREVYLIVVILERVSEGKSVVEPIESCVVSFECVLIIVYVVTDSMPAQFFVSLARAS